MTDRQQQEGESEQTAQEQESSFSVEEETGAEAWQEELPPEDDFQDAPDQGEEALDDEGVPSSEEEVIIGDKKRGKYVLLGVVAVGVLLVGGMAYLQFGGETQEGARPVPLASVVDVKKIQKEAGVAGQETEEAAVTPRTGQADIASLYRAAQQQQAQGAAALPKSLDPLAQTEEADKTSLGVSTGIISPPGQEEASQPSPAKGPVSAPPPAASAAPVAAPQVSSVEALPVVESRPEVSATKAAAPVAITNENAESISDLRAQIKELRQQVSELKASLDQALKEKETGAEKPKALEEEAALLARLERIEKTLGEKKASAEPPKPQASIALQETAEPSDENVASSPKEEKKAAPKKKAVAKPAPKKKKTENVKISEPSEKESWVLRAATPEAAWVSKGDYAAALRRVAVGETLPGLGQIKEIRQKGETWEVVGTMGVLK